MLTSSQFRVHALSSSAGVLLHHAAHTIASSASLSGPGHHLLLLLLARQKEPTHDTEPSHMQKSMHTDNAALPMSTPFPA